LDELWRQKACFGLRQSYDQTLATFEVKPGEVMLTDAFFATGKNVDFQNKSCVENNETFNATSEVLILL
jgi:hypothetical protein